MYTSTTVLHPFSVHQQSLMMKLLCACFEARVRVRVKLARRYLDARLCSLIDVLGHARLAGGPAWADAGAGAPAVRALTGWRRWGLQGARDVGVQVDNI